MAQIRRRLRVIAPVLLASGWIALGCGARAWAQATAPATNQPAEDDAPSVTPLTVGVLQIGSDPALVVDSMGVTVTVDKVTYDYKLRNKGAVPLALTASVTMPDLEVSSDGKAFYELPAPAPDNPVNLTVTANQKSVATTPFVEALALGINRLADLKAAHIPLVPFSADTEKALGAAPPETLTKLAGLGLIAPPDPTQADSTASADWSLHVTHGWTQLLEPNAATAMAVSFAPIKAIYIVDLNAAKGFEEVKEQLCLTPKDIGMFRTFFKTKTTTLEVVDITLATDKPARWIDSPAMTIQVRKPKPNSFAIFCGVDPTTAMLPVVKGTATDDGSNNGVRVMIVTPMSP